MRFMVAILACVLASSLAYAQPAPTSMPTKVVRCKLPEAPGTAVPLRGEPVKVAIGMHVLRLTGLDIPNNQFALDFYLWFRWTGDELKPHETFEITNGKIDGKQVEKVDKVNGVNYACVRVQATMTCFWDVSRFPLGTQRLQVQFEDDDLEATQLVYVADTENSGVQSGFRVAGWEMEKFSAQSDKHEYCTNYGYPLCGPGEKTAFSRAAFMISLHRADRFHSFKIFSGLYLSALVAFTVFMVKPDHRLGLIVGAVFAVVSSHTVISAYLPEAGMLTLADKLHLATAAVVLIALFETAYSLHLLHKSKESRSRRLDRVTFWLTAPAFVAVNVWLLLG